MDKPDRMPNVPPFVKFVASAVPMVFDNSLSYYEALCALWKYIQGMTDVINNNATLEEEYIVKFNELKTFVDEYFDNLDVQEEINNKLDQMAEDGTLQEIITAYIQANTAWCFDSVAAMKTAENFINGSYAHTYGYHSVNDGGGAFYKIRTVTNEDVVDESFIIALADETLVAELIHDDFVNVKQLGLYGDDTHDDSAKLASLMSYAKLFFPQGTYKLSNSLTINSHQMWRSNYKSNYNILPNLKLYGANTSINIESNTRCTFEGLCFRADTTESETTPTTGLVIKSPFTEFYNCNFYDFVSFGINFNANCWLCKFDTCRFERNGTAVRTNNDCNFMKFINCYIHENTVGVYVYGTTENGGSPQVTFDKCDIEDNTSRGIMIGGSWNNEVFINDCYFEHHAGFAIYGQAVQTNPTKGYRSIHINNSRFYSGASTSGLLYLYWFEHAYINNCTIDVYGNSNDFYLLSTSASSPLVNITNTDININNSPNVKPFLKNRVYYNDVKTSDATAASGMPLTGIGGTCFVGEKKAITDMKIFDGQYWRNNDGSYWGYN